MLAEKMRREMLFGQLQPHMSCFYMTLLKEIQIALNLKSIKIMTLSNYGQGINLKEVMDFL